MQQKLHIEHFYLTFQTEKKGSMGKDNRLVYCPLRLPLHRQLPCAVISAHPASCVMLPIVVRDIAISVTATP